METTIVIYNIIRKLGIIPTLKGSKLLAKAIEILIENENEFIVFEDLYKIIALHYSKANSVQIRNAIKYAIDNRDNNKAVTNFEKIFGYEYSPYYFTNKIIIEEIARIIKLKYIIT